MRCSMRESNLRPAMFTSTPIGRCKKSLGFTFVDNSPILKFNQPDQFVSHQNQSRHPISIFKIQGNKKVPLNSQEKDLFLKKPPKSCPSMVVISDSEEEDNVHKEITLLQKKLNPSMTRKSVKETKMNPPKEEKMRQLRNKNIVKPSQDDTSESVTKKSLKRVSRVAAIIDEIMKERQSMIAASPIIKQEIKSENNRDAVVERVEENDLRSKRSSRLLTTLESDGNRRNLRRFTYTPNIVGDKGATAPKTSKVNNEKIENIENKEKATTRRTRKRAKTIIPKSEDKENISYKKDNLLEDIIEKVKTPLKEMNTSCDLKSDEVKKIESVSATLLPSSTISQHFKSNIMASSSIRGEQFNENSPVFYAYGEIKDNEWIQVSNQKGVFVKKTFRLSNICNGFVKIESKCSLSLHSSRSQIFNVAEGRGIFLKNDEKIKIAPGHTFTVPSGFPCEILNTGLKKNLIISFTKVVAE